MSRSRSRSRNETSYDEDDVFFFTLGLVSCLVYIYFPSEYAK